MLTEVSPQQLLYSLRYCHPPILWSFVPIAQSSGPHYHGYSIPWTGKCVVAFVAVLTLTRRAGTGTLSQVIIQYDSLKYPR